MLALFEFLFLLSMFATSEQCLKTLPPEEIYITSTEPLFETTTVNLCNDCDMYEYVGERKSDDFIIIIPDPLLVDGCLEFTLACHSDGSCNNVAFFAKSGGQTVQLTTSAGGVDAKFICNRDGTFSQDDVKNIEEVTCACTD